MSSTFWENVTKMHPDSLRREALRLLQAHDHAIACWARARLKFGIPVDGYFILNSRTQLNSTEVKYHIRDGCGTAVHMPCLRPSSPQPLLDLSYQHDLVICAIMPAKNRPMSEALCSLGRGMICSFRSVHDLLSVVRGRYQIGVGAFSRVGSRGRCAGLTRLGGIKMRTTSDGSPIPSAGCGGGRSPSTKYRVDRLSETSSVCLAKLGPQTDPAKRGHIVTTTSKARTSFLLPSISPPVDYSYFYIWPLEISTYLVFPSILYSKSYSAKVRELAFQHS